LYFLDEYDMNFVKSQGIKLKPNERLFRYFTRNTAIAGMIPLLKINIESGLIYFSKPTDFGDETLEFETKGLKADYINLVKPAMYGEGGNVADIVSKQLINLQSALDEKNYEKFEYISNEIHEISDSDGLTENEYERWDDLRTKMNEYLLDKFIKHGSQYAKGGGVGDYKKRIKKFGFKPYGKEKGRFVVSYMADGEKQEEVWETKEMAVDTAKRYRKLFQNVKVTDETGADVKYAEGGAVNAPFKPDVEIAKDKDGNNYLVSSEKMDNAEAVLLKKGGATPSRQKKRGWRHKIK
jgi:hypothetical protein